MSFMAVLYSQGRAGGVSSGRELGGRAPKAAPPSSSRATASHQPRRLC